jgi:hypothetical protein
VWAVQARVRGRERASVWGGSAGERRYGVGTNKCMSESVDHSHVFVDVCEGRKRQGGRRNRAWGGR